MQTEYEEHKRVEEEKRAEEERRVRWVTEMLSKRTQNTWRRMDTVKLWYNATIDIWLPVTWPLYVFLSSRFHSLFHIFREEEEAAAKLAVAENSPRKFPTAHAFITFGGSGRSVIVSTRGTVVVRAVHDLLTDKQSLEMMEMIGSFKVRLSVQRERERERERENDKPCVSPQC